MTRINPYEAFGAEYGVQLRGGVVAPAASAAYAIGYGHRPVVARLSGGPWNVLSADDIAALRAALIPDCIHPGHGTLARHRRAGQARCPACCRWEKAYEVIRAARRTSRKAAAA